MKKEHLTNWELKKHFTSNFALANYLIAISHRLIEAGQEFSLTELIQNMEKNPHSYIQYVQIPEESGLK